MPATSSCVAHADTIRPTAPPAIETINPCTQQLPHDPRARAADREPNRDLLLPRRSERQHHVGEVEARREQHARRQSLEQRERRPQLRSSCGLVLMLNRLSGRTSIPGSCSRRDRPARGRRTITLSSLVGLRARVHASDATDDNQRSGDCAIGQRYVDRASRSRSRSHRGRRAARNIRCR